MRSQIKAVRMRKQSEQKSSKYQYLAGNIALFSVSNFVSKILVFLLVPLYTNVLSTYEYGIADILQVTLLLLVPAVTVNMGEAALRFGIERTTKRGSILRIGLGYTLRADIFIIAAGIGAMFFVQPVIKWYIVLFIFLFMANSLYEYLVLFFQGCEMVPVVVIGSVSSTVIMIASNIVFLLVIKIGLNGYILSQIFAYLIASIIMLLIGRMGFGKIAFEKDDELKREMVAYGIPMIAYSTGSWVNNAADRYIVAGICGSAANGVYGVAYKIPAILMVFQRIFAQAWQMSATKSYTDEKSEEFFATMYKVYNTFMVIGCSILILLVKPIAAFMFRKDFYEAWMLVPPLLISVIFGALTGFLGSICLAHKDSKSMGIATTVGAVLNVILNCISVPRYGAMGASWATALSYFVMCALAYVFVRKHVVIRNNIAKESIGYVVLVTEAIVMIAGVKYNYVVCALCCLVLTVLYFKTVKDIMKKLLGTVGSKIKKGGNDGRK